MLSRHAVSVRSAHKQAASAISKQVEQVTKIPSGLTVATLENNGPLTQLVLAFRAGSRYEKSNQAGLVHYLRNFVGRDTSKYHGTSVIWTSSVYGANLKAFATRDVFGVSMAVPRDNASHALSIIGHAAAKPAFKLWEVEDVIPTIKADNAYRAPYDFVFDGIHRAAFRNGGLGNSIYAPCSQIGHIGSADLVTFANSHLVSGNGIIFATNLEQEELVRYAENYSPIEQGNAVSPSSSPYKGGDFRFNANSEFAHVIVAGEGASGNNAKAVAVQAVLLTILGNSTPVKFSVAPSGALAKSVDEGVSVSAFQAVHSDTGLAGFYLVGKADKVEAATLSAVGALKTLKISDIEAAKKQALNNALRAKAHTDNYSIERAAQLLVSSESYIPLIEKVNASEVETALQKIVKKYSVASYGNIDRVPYSDSL